MALRGRPDRPLIRLATVAPWGASVFLVPFRPPTARELSHLREPLAGFAPRRAARGETIGLYTSGSGGGGRRWPKSNAATL